MTTALVTGANQGIGLATVRALVRAGIDTWLAARDPDAGASAVSALAREGLTARYVRLDVTDPASIDAAVTTVGALDILINNAGISDRTDGAPSTIEVDVLRRIFEVNLFGVHAVTRAFLPLLRRSAAGRIVNVSSSLGSQHWSAGGRGPAIVAYRSSKTALNTYTIELARELAGTRVKVNCVAPGFTPTNLNTHLIPPAGAKLQTPDEGAVAPVKYALIGPDGPTGGFFDANGPMPW